MASDPGRTEPQPAAASAAPSGRVPPPGLLRALSAALRELTGIPLRSADAAALGRGGLFFPAIGLVLGLLAAAIARPASDLLPPIVLAPVIVGLLLLPQRGASALALATLAGWAIGGRAGERAPQAAGVALGSALLAVVLVVKALAVLALPGSALAPALVLALLLGRWAPVVQAYGAIAAPDDGFARALVPNLGFNEFAIASVGAMAATLVLADAVGLVLLFVVAAGAIVLRVLVHRVRGGVSRTSLLAGGEIAETSALVACAALARALGGA